MSEVVTSIPYVGLPLKIPPNPSFVELDEEENPVEKFKATMVSVSSILLLDRLKQVHTQL